ncbi:hypothetical protein FQA39_LY07383 [Lamprigera yunnana]|nr:hypothetical protein FQA39_LY07383 [Lamprigera yunnana]
MTNKVKTLNIGGRTEDTQDNNEQIPLQQTPPQIINNPVTQGDVMADVETSDNENDDDTLKIIPQQITAKKRVEDLKVGDYILPLFVSTGKRAVVHYKYIAKILQVLEGDDFEVQCLKGLDETKTTFKFIENDQCVIAKKEILVRLPDPQLVQFGRILKTVFPAEVEVYEKS